MMKAIIAAMGSMVGWHGPSLGRNQQRLLGKRQQTQEQRADALAAAEAKRNRRAERNKRVTHDH